MQPKKLGENGAPIKFFFNYSNNFFNYVFSFHKEEHTIFCFNLLFYMSIYQGHLYMLHSELYFSL